MVQHALLLGQKIQCGRFGPDRADVVKLDLRRPSIVLTGAWNPAIFQAGWILRFLFQVPDGRVEPGGALRQWC